jgi:hypothetical protein
MHWKGYGRKLSWSVLSYSGMLSGGLRKTAKNICQDSRSLGRDLNLGPPEYKTGVTFSSTLLQSVWPNIMCIWFPSNISFFFFRLLVLSVPRKRPQFWVETQDDVNLLKCQLCWSTISSSWGSPTLVWPVSAVKNIYDFYCRSVWIKTCFS